MIININNYYVYPETETHKQYIIFRYNQLAVSLTPMSCWTNKPKENNIGMRKLLILFIVISVSISSVYSQNNTIKGKVISDQFDILPGVFIMINDTVKVGTTDLDGFFKLDIPTSVKKISFKYVGVDPTTIEFLDKCDKIEVVIMLTSTYDFITLKRAERKRKKRYKKLPEIHKQAFEKGIFETEYACYKREFEPYFLN